MGRFGWSVVVAAAFLAVTAAVGIGFLAHRQPDSVQPEEDGGVKDNTDQDSPKSLTSREITALYTSFYCSDPLEPSRSGGYWFEIGENDSGELMLSVSGVMKGSSAVEPYVLEQVQEIIEAHELVKLNGVDSVTQALPPEYGPCSLSVDYVSGERLYFQIDGNPDARWCRDLKELFFQVFAGAGYAEFLPPVEALSITNCTIAFGIDDLTYDYGFILDTNGVMRFYRSVYDMAKGDILAEDLIELDDTLLEGLQKAVEEYGLGTLVVDGVKYDPTIEHQPGGFVDIFIDYENGRQLYLQAAGEEIPDEWFPVRERLKTYLDSLFDAQEKIE